MEEVIHASYLEEIRQQVARDNGSGVVSPPREILVPRLDGSAAPVECIGSAIIWDGQPAIEVVIRDIASRKRPGELLVGLQKRLELADRAGRMGLWEWKFDTEEHTYGDPPRRLELLNNTSETGAVEDTELVRKRRDGQGVTVCVDAALRNDEDEVPHILEACVEAINENKISENQFLQAQKMEAVGRIAGGIAHDFNNVLMISSSYADLILQAAGANERVLNYAEQIKRAIARATIVIRQLLAFSREQMLEPENLDLRDVVSDLSKILPNLMGQEVEVIASTEAIPRVLADRGQAEQVIMNLALNARDAMPSGGCLKIETRSVAVDPSLAATMRPLQPGDYVCLSVSDTGTGMDSQTKLRIFEPFFTTKERGKGTGLGLAAVYGIVKQSRGFIFVESEIGQGTTFKIFFPATSAPAEQKRHRPLDSVIKGRGETILVVEDEPQLREAIVQYLRSIGYTVLSAASAADAIQLATVTKSGIAAVLTDLVLPGTDGSEVARQLRSMRPEILVLFMSGYSDRSAEELGPGAVFLRKPFNLAELALRVRELLNDTWSRVHGASEVRDLQSL
jgi:signal transduction histidine kinase/ActR/RegA family two-component response regulator